MPRKEPTKPPRKGLPTKVKMMGKVWHVVYVNEVDEDEQLLGSCEAARQMIRIDRNQSPGSMRDTIIHELAHAYYSYVLSDLDDSQLEERIVLFTTASMQEIMAGLGRGFFEGIWPKRNR